MRRSRPTGVRPASVGVLTIFALKYRIFSTIFKIIASYYGHMGLTTINVAHKATADALPLQVYFPT